MKKKTALLLVWALLFSLALPTFQVEAAVTEQQIIWLEKDYDDIDPFIENRATVVKDEKWGFIDPDGKEIIPLQYSWAGYFSDGVAVVTKGEYPNLRYGIIDHLGNEVLPFEYTWVGAFHEGLSQVQIGSYPESKIGFADIKGNIVVPLIYEDCGVFQNGLAPVRLNGLWGYIDREGNTVIPFIYDWASNFRGDYAQVYRIIEEKYKMAFINSLGEEISEFKYDVGDLFSEGLAVVSQSNDYVDRYGYINTLGEEVIPLVYDWADTFREGVAAVNSNGLWGLINTKGQLLTPIKYNYIWPALNGYNIINSIDDKWGFINTLGQEIVPPIYDWADGFSDGLAKVGIINDDGYKFGFLNEKGKEVIPLKYDNVYQTFEQGLNNVMYDGRWGFIDKNGQVVVPFQFDAALPFSNDRAIVAVGEKIGLLKHPSLNRPALHALPTTSKITVDGKEVVFEAYLINDNNYFKLRDLATVLSGSSKQFQVGWDAEKLVISLTSNKSYTQVGGELALGDGKNKVALLNNASIYLDGVPQELTAYNINGNNYFKLRDLGSLFNFGIEWDAKTKTVIINSAGNYVE